MMPKGRVYRPAGWKIAVGQLIGAGGCWFVRRWTVEAPSGRGVRLHHFLPDVEETVPHDHPWPWFLTVVLRGEYTDIASREGVETGRDRVKAPTVRLRRGHEHRTIAGPAGAWTVVVNGVSSRNWGFWHRPGWWVSWQQFRDLGLGRAACESPDPAADGWTPEPGCPGCGVGHEPGALNCLHAADEQCVACR